MNNGTMDKPCTAEKIFSACFLPVQKLPLGFHYAFGRFLAFLAEKVLGYRRDVVMVNLARSFPEMKWKEIRSLSRKFYSHLGEIIAEAIWFGGSKGNPERLSAGGICTYSNPELLADLYLKSPSVMIMDSHFGNWEIIGGLLQYIGKEMPFGPDDVAVVYKKLENRFWNDFMAGNRSAPIEDYRGYVESREVLRYAIEHKAQKKIYIFPTDQFPYRFATKHEIPSFMHQKTQVMTGAAALAHKFHMPVLYMGMRRTGKGHYVTDLKIVAADAADMSPEEIMTEYYRLLEEDVKANPENYLWSHNRWK